MPRFPNGPKTPSRPRIRPFAAGRAAVLAVVLATVGCSAEPPGPPPTPVSRTTWIDESKLVDLTHTFDDSTLYWPTNRPFQLTRVAWGRTPGGWWYASNDFAASEHGGTHADAPIHFHEGGWNLDQVPLERLIGPAVVVDVSRSCQTDPDYAATRADIQGWEERHGPLPQGAIVLLRTGWAGRWPDRGRYLGSVMPGDASNLHFPGFSEEAARYLVESGKVAGVGLDTASIDPGPSRTFKAHQVFGAANIYGLENLDALDRLPESGSTLIALPMKIGGGSGGPTRVVAVLP